MSKERDIIVSGVMFLVALESYKVFMSLSAGKIMAVCDPVLRFSNSLMAAVLIAATSFSVLISFWYFKKFSHQACDPFIGEDEEENEDEEETEKDE